MLLGFAIALAVNAIPKLLKGPVIFFSLLPLIVTPLIGSLVLYWMLNADGILGATLQRVFDDPNLSTTASPVLTWIALMFYGTWSMAPFSFVVFYAGLQSVPSDTLESAMIDGASRLDRVRFVMLPAPCPARDVRRARADHGQLPRVRADRRVRGRGARDLVVLGDLQRPCAGSPTSCSARRGAHLGADRARGDRCC